MNRQRLAAVCLVMLTVGCMGQVTPAPQPPPPLTVEQWKSLPVEEKYDDATFQRLRQADPSLGSERNWQKFQREVMVPERKRDIPGIPGQPAPTDVP